MTEDNLRRDERLSFFPGLEPLEVGLDPEGLQQGFTPRRVHPWDVTKSNTAEVLLGVLDRAGRERCVIPLEILQR